MISFSDATSTGTSATQGLILTVTEYPLTSGQREFVRRALSEFDGTNLNDDDAQSIVEAFAEVDIKPGREISDLMLEMGFDLTIQG